MILAAFAFFLVGVIAGVLGLTGAAAGTAANIAWILMAMSIVVSLILGFLGGRPLIED